MKSGYLVIFFILLNCLQGFGQSHDIDSLHHSLQSEKNDTNKVTLENWKGNLEQVDDILVMGIKV